MDDEQEYEENCKIEIIVKLCQYITLVENKHKPKLPMLVYSQLNKVKCTTVCCILHACDHWICLSSPLCCKKFIHVMLLELLINKTNF